MENRVKVLRTGVVLPKVTLQVFLATRGERHCYFLAYSLKTEVQTIDVALLSSELVKVALDFGPSDIEICSWLASCKLVVKLYSLET